MTVSDLRVLVDNLDEYIHIPGGIERLKKTVLHLAVSGQIVVQDPSEGTGEELYNKIQSVKAKLPKKQKSLLEIEASEIPYDIPDSWKWVRLGNVGLTVTGKTPSTNKHSLTEGKIPFVGPGNIAKNHILTGDYQKWLTEEASKSSEIARTNDILMVCIGGSIGKAALVDTPLCFNQQINKISPIELEPRYVFTALISEYFQRLIIDSAVGGATPIINQTRWANLPLPLPPLDEQKRIVKRVYEIFALIDELDTKYKAEEAERSKLVKSSLRALSHNGSQLALENLTSIIKTKVDAAELRKAILHLAVSGNLVPQIKDEGTGEDYNDQIQIIYKPKKTLPVIDNYPFDIPQNWEWTRLGNLFEITSSKRVMQADWKTSGIPFLRARDLSNAIKTGHIESDIFVSESYYEEVSASSGVPVAGDIMVSGVGTIGTPYVVKEDDKFYFKDATILWFRNIAGVYVDYVELIFHSSFMKAIIMSQSQGTTVNTYTIANARLNMIPLPPLAEQKRIVQKTTELLNHVAELEKNLVK